MHALQLVELFGSTRDAWIEEDLAGWLAPNRIYDGVPAVLNQLLQQAEVYIVTTKQVHVKFDAIAGAFPEGRPKHMPSVDK